MWVWNVASNIHWLYKFIQSAYNGFELLQRFSNNIFSYERKLFFSACFFQKQPPELFCKKADACNFIKKENLAQVVFLWSFPKNTSFTEHIWATVSVLWLGTASNVNSGHNGQTSFLLDTQNRGMRKSSLPTRE